MVYFSNLIHSIIRQSLVVAHNGSDTTGIFLGHGNGSFQNRTTYQTGLSPQSVAVVDFGNDDILDIIVANHDINNVGAFCGHGDGTFADIISTNRVWIGTILRSC